MMYYVFFLFLFSQRDYILKNHIKYISFFHFLNTKENNKVSVQLQINGFTHHSSRTNKPVTSVMLTYRKIKAFTGFIIIRVRTPHFRWGMALHWYVDAFRWSGVRTLPLCVVHAGTPYYKARFKNKIQPNITFKFQF